MSQLYGRSCNVFIGPKGKPGRLIEGLRIGFKIEKSLEANPNMAQIEITNLSQETRAFIQQKDSVVILSAGYGKETKGIFTGDVARVTTKSHGADTVTLIEAGDGEFAFQNAKLDLSFAPGTSVGQVFDRVAGVLGLAKGDQKGINASQVFQNGLSLSGMAKDHMDMLTRKQDLNWSIQDGQLQVLPRSSGTAQEAVLLTPSTGLIGSPKQIVVVNQELAKPKNGHVAESGIQLVALLNGDLRPGRYIKVESREVKGLYVIQKVEFNGDTHGSDWYAGLEAKAV